VRFLKKEHNYSIGEQEEMLPFEREFHLQLIQGETLAKENKPAQGWSQYADDIGATAKGRYTDKYQVIEDTPAPRGRPG
jgi:hypothetical protein